MATEQTLLSSNNIILLSTGGIVGKNQNTLKSHLFIDHPGVVGGLECGIQDA